MKLKNFMENLNKLIEENPMVLELDVISSINGEGDGFNSVIYEPSIGCLVEGETFKQYVPEDEEKICEWWDEENAICKLCKYKGYCSNNKGKYSCIVNGKLISDDDEGCKYNEINSICIN